jgi:hypothetical protein
MALGIRACFFLGDKKHKKGVISETAPDVSLRSRYGVERLFTRVFKGGAPEIVDKSGLLGPGDPKTQAQKIILNNNLKSLCFLCF